MSAKTVGDRGRDRHLSYFPALAKFQERLAEFPQRQADMRALSISESLIQAQRRALEKWAEKFREWTE